MADAEEPGEATTNVQGELPSDFSAECRFYENRFPEVDDLVTGLEVHQTNDFDRGLTAARMEFVDHLKVLDSEGG